MQCRRVFHAKYEDVANEDGGVDVEQALHQEEVAEGHVQRAKRVADRSEDVAEQCRYLNQEVPAHGEAHPRGQVLVDQRAVVVVPLVPGDKQWHSDDHSQ